MIFLLLLSLLSLTVIVWRGLSLRMKLILPPEVETAVDKLQNEKSFYTMCQTVKQHPSPLSNVLSTLIEHLNYPAQDVSEAVQTRARHEIMKLETGLVLLEIATGVGPILGLLGTLSGLVSIFANLGNDPTMVARGIAEALNTTIVGLGIAAPSLIAFNYFSRKIEIMAITMETLSTEILTAVKSIDFTASDTQ